MTALEAVDAAGGAPDPAAYLTPERSIELANCYRSLRDQVRDFNGR